MKKIETKQERTVVDTIVTYEAIDGTIFKTQQECEIYEQTAQAVIKTKYNTLIHVKSDEYALFGGEQDHKVDVLNIKSQADIDIVLQMVQFITNNGTEYLEKHVLPILQNALINEEYAFMAWNYDEDYMWPIGTISSIIGNITRICSKNE